MQFHKFIILGVFALLVSTQPAFAGGDATAGEAKAATCAGCHGAAGEGNTDNPKLAGLDEAYQVEQLMAFKSGARENAMMQMFAGQLSEQDMADVSAYYAGLSSE
jgi:cytochrome c553